LKPKSTPLQKVARTLDDHFNETWICYWKDGKLVSRELESCTAEEFGAWLTWVYPPSKEFLEKNLRNYDSYEKRKSEFANLVAFLTRLPKVFEAYGEKSFLPKEEKKTDKRSGGKNE